MVELRTGQTGTDWFGYTVSDGRGGEDAGLVSITVSGINDAPVAANDVYGVSEDTPFSAGVGIGLLIHDTDAENDALAIINVDATGLDGLLTWAADGSFTYDPNRQFEYLDLGETAQDTFQYTVSDGNGGVDTATVTLTIAGRNDAPVLAGLTINSLINENGVAVLSGNIIAPDLTDTFTLVVDWGDGTAPETFTYGVGIRAFSESHPYLDDKSYRDTFGHQCRSPDHHRRRWP